MKASIDRGGCISCGICAETCPEVFEMDGEGIAAVCGEITEDNRASAQEAAESCPTAVIQID